MDGWMDIAAQVHLPSSCVTTANVQSKREVSQILTKKKKKKRPYKHLTPSLPMGSVMIFDLLLARYSPSSGA